MEKDIDPDRLYKFICGEIEASMHALDTGKEVNMENIDRNVRRFCDIVTKLPAAEAKSYDEKIDNIVKELTYIVETLTERKLEVGEQINYTSQRRKAQSAYGTAMLSSVNEVK
ncbi:MAG: hypothetical protein COV35_07985 [Alphaproteobacteria bacterium CG11_big_fil_rev_8_21_14_0_20_39_49]|nr:MAG: hypothetical protein COV35_07985 [Alphaproteobacteria bacterium CG11_big_fil_rev_8_21_14_0_20_39_49]